MISARPATARSHRSCSTGSTKPMRKKQRRTPRRSGTATSAALATTTDARPADDGFMRVKRKETGMLTHPTEQRLVALGLTGMAKALEEQRRQPDIATLRLRGTARSARRPRGDRSREQTAGQPIEVRRAQTERRRRGYRYEGGARARQGAVCKARRRRVDRRYSRI